MRNGFGTGRTARSSMRRIPQRNMRTFIPFYFENEHARELLEELKSVVTYWAEQGIRIFRVDNPHTKPFPFWEWLIEEVRREYPDAHFSGGSVHTAEGDVPAGEAGLHRSRIPISPGKIRNAEITQYFTELTQTSGARVFSREPVAKHSRHSNEYLQDGGAPAFMIRLDSCGDLGRELWHLWPGIRAVREPGGEAGERGVFGFGKIPDSSLAHRSCLQPARD